MNRTKEVTKDDMKKIAKLEAKCFLDAWSVKGLQDVYEGDFYFIYKIEQEKEIAGYIIGRYVMDEGELLRVAVDPCFRGRSFGQKLVKKLLKEMKLQGVKTVFLEVRASNKEAIGLYEKMKFTSVGQRKSYYHHPTEDAILMKWKEEIC